MKNKLCNFSLLTFTRYVQFLSTPWVVPAMCQSSGSKVKSLRLTDSARRYTMTFCVWLTRWDGHDECERLSGARGAAKVVKWEKLKVHTKSSTRVQRCEKQRVGKGSGKIMQNAMEKALMQHGKFVWVSTLFICDCKWEREFGAVVVAEKWKQMWKRHQRRRSDVAAWLWCEHFAERVQKRNIFHPFFSFNRLTSHELK